MYDNSRRYLNLLVAGGIPLVIAQIVKEERADPKVTSTSTMAANPNLALESLDRCVMDIPIEQFKGMISGSIFRDHLLPSPKLIEQYAVSSQNSSQDSAATSISELSINSPSGQNWDTNDEYEMEKILESRVDPDTGMVEFLVKWKGWTESSNEWRTYDHFHDENDPNAMNMAIRFLADNPSQDRHGWKDYYGLPKITTKVPAMYGQWFLDTSPLHQFENPTARVILDFVRLAKLYCEDLLPPCKFFNISPGSKLIFVAHPDHLEQKQLIIDVDNPDPQWNIAAKGWTRALTVAGHRKHLRSTASPTVISRDRQDKWRNEMIPTMESQLATIPASDLDLPVPFPLSEFGITDCLATREKSHATHTGTTAALALFECISFAVYNARYRWCFLPVSTYRDRADGPVVESFFHRLGQSYTWTGGVNSKAAGVSTKDADNMTQEQRIAGHGTINFAELDRNISIAKSRLETYKFVLGEPSRQANRQEAEALRKRVRELERQEKEEFLASASALEAKIDQLIEMNDRQHRLAKVANLTKQILEKRTQMEELVNKK